MVSDVRMLTSHPFGVVRLHRLGLFVGSGESDAFISWATFTFFQ